MKADPPDTDQNANSAAQPTRRILVLLAHPSLDRSEVKRPMADAVRGLAGVTWVDLYVEYRVRRQSRWDCSDNQDGNGMVGHAPIQSTTVHEMAGKAA